MINRLTEYWPQSSLQSQENRAIHPANSGDQVARTSTPQPQIAISPENKPRTLDEVARVFSVHQALIQREAFPASQLRVKGDRVFANGREFQLASEGLRRLCKWFRAPAEYLGTLKPELRGRLLQEHLAEGRFPGTKLNDRNSCIVSRGGVFLDLGRSDLYTLDNNTVLQAVREGITGDTDALEVQKLQLDDEFFTLDIVSPQFAAEVRPGDVLYAGVHVAHSQLEGDATQVMAYIVRLLCQNGLVQRQCLGEGRRSTPRTRRLSANRPAVREMQMAQIRKLVSDTFKDLEKRLAAIRRLTNKSVEVGTTLERFLRQAHLFSHAMMNRLLEAWEKEGRESSAFGALNALTRVASHFPGLPSWQRERLSRLAGVYANQEVHLCPHCFSVLTNR